MTRVVRSLLKSIFHTSSLRTLYFSSEMHFFTLGPLIIQKWHFRKKVVVTTSTSSKKVWNYKRYLFYGTLNTLSFGKMVKNWKTYFILHQICQSIVFYHEMLQKISNPSRKLFWWVCSYTFGNYFLRKTLIDQYYLSAFNRKI